MHRCSMLFPTFQDETHCNLQVNMAKERWNTVPMFSGFLSVLHMARQKWGTGATESIGCTLPCQRRPLPTSFSAGFVHISVIFSQKWGM